MANVQEVLAADNTAIQLLLGQCQRLRFLASISATRMSPAFTGLLFLGLQFAPPGFLTQDIP